MRLIYRLSLILCPVVYFGIPVVVSAESDVQTTHCQSVVARILSAGDQFHSKGSLLCSQDRVRPLQGEKPIVVCYGSDSRLLKGAEGRVGNLCSPDRRTRQLYKNRLKHFKARGSGKTKGRPNLIRPFGVSILQPRPYLVWNPVQGATHYLVSVQTYGRKWEQIVRSGNSLSYPQNWPAMEHGNVYRGTIFAYKQDKIIASSKEALGLLPERNLKLIQEALAEIQQLSLSPAEKTRVLDAVYMSQNLLDESIGILRSLQDKGEGTSQLNRLLVERYYQAGQPELAAPITKEAQFPIKIKFPQK